MLFRSFCKITEVPYEDLETKIALEGAMCGKPSVAISLGSHEATDFVFSGEIALKVLRATMGKLAARTALNVNIPDIPRDEIRGIKYTRLGIREYEGLYKTRRLERKSFEAVYSGIPIKYDSDNNQIDVIAAQNNYITISPLQYDLTNHYLIDSASEALSTFSLPNSSLRTATSAGWMSLPSNTGLMTIFTFVR